MWIKPYGFPDVRYDIKELIEKMESEVKQIMGGSDSLLEKQGKLQVIEPVLESLYKKTADEVPLKDLVELFYRQHQAAKHDLERLITEELLIKARAAFSYSIAWLHELLNGGMKNASI